MSNEAKRKQALILTDYQNLCTNKNYQSRSHDGEHNLEEECTMEENDSMLKAEFQTQVSEGDLMDFKIYHNYHSISGVAGLLFGIIALIICVVSINRVNISYTLMMGFFGLFFTIYTPIGMKIKVKNQMKKVPAFRGPVKYTVTEEKIMLNQGDISEELLWDDIFKIKCTGKSLVLYITSVRANIIPLKDLKDQTECFLMIAGKKLKPFQIKLNTKKVIAAANRQ
jgi:hypothetical protein